MKHPGLLLAICILPALSAPLRAQTPADGAPTQTRELLKRLDAALEPLRRGPYSEKDRRPIAEILSQIRVQAAALQPPPGAQVPPARAEALIKLEKAAVEMLRLEDEFWEKSPTGLLPSAKFPADTAAPLKRESTELAAAFSRLFPELAPGTAAFANAPPIGPISTDSAARAAGRGKGAASDPRLFYDGGATGAGDTFAPVGGIASNGNAERFPKERVPFTGRSTHISDLTLGPVPVPKAAADTPSPVEGLHAVAPSAQAALRAAADSTPVTGGLARAIAAPAYRDALKAPSEKPTIAASETACRQASDDGLIAGLCGSSWTAWSAPVAVGVLDAFKDQFGTVSGVVSLLAFTALGLLLSALSGGVGLVATLIKALCGIAILWTVLSMLNRLAGAIKEFASTSTDDPQHWRALRTIGKVGGEVLILVLMAFAGYKIGERPAVKNAAASMTKALQGQMNRLGIRPAAPAPELRAAFSDPPALALGRSLSDPNSLRAASVGEVTSLIPKDWAMRPMRTGRGTIYEMPGTRGADIIQISRGNPGASDALHRGAYVKISKAGTTVRVELKP